MRLANFNLTTQAPAAHLSLRRASLHAISHTAYLSPYGDPGIELTWLGLYTLGQLSQAWPSTQACTNSARMRDDDLAITAAPATHRDPRPSSTRPAHSTYIPNMVFVNVVLKEVGDQWAVVTSVLDDESPSRTLARGMCTDVQVTCVVEHIGTGTPASPDSEFQM